MENNNMILSDQTVVKEYQIPELVDLNGIGEAMGTPPVLCTNGSGNSFSCDTGTSGPVK